MLDTNDHGDTATDNALQVRILWGDDTPLHDRQLRPPRSFFVGETTDARGRPDTDFAIGSASLGCDRMPVALADGGEVAAVIPAGATGEVRFADGQRLDLSDDIVRRRVAPCPAMAGAVQLRLPPGAEASVKHAGFTFVVGAGDAPPRVGAPAVRVDWHTHRATLASMAFFGTMLMLFQLLPPHAWAMTYRDLDDQSRLVRTLLTAREMELLPPQPAVEGGADGGGAAATDEAGALGKPDVAHTHKRHANRGPRDNRDPQVPREVARAAAAQEGIIGVILAQALAGPSSPYAALNAQGRDAEDIMGAMTGAQIGLSGGAMGLSMAGTGRGGGGDAVGTVGSGPLGTRGVGGWRGGPGGPGAGVGGTGTVGGLRKRGARVPPAPSHDVAVRGSISREAIRRTIRRHVAEVRYCYEQALQGRPDLQGRVAVRFLIGADGAVRMAAVENSSLGNPRAEQCIAGAVRRWSFPTPEGGGVVTVSYPFVLRQTGG